MKKEREPRAKIFVSEGQAGTGKENLTQPNAPRLTGKRLENTSLRSDNEG